MPSDTTALEGYLAIVRSSLLAAEHGLQSAHALVTRARYKTAYPGGFAGPNAGAVPAEDCAIDWPDFSADDEPIHLDTCRVMTGNDQWCTCGLSLLDAAGARFTLEETTDAN